MPDNSGLAPQHGRQQSLPAPSPRSRATVLDVALLAGVSGRTVSRVVANGANISPQTRQRVMDAVKVLHFRPNGLARELRSGGISSSTVGFVVGDLANSFYLQVASGVERVLGDLGLTMLLSATRDDPSLESRAVGAVLERRVRALLLVPVGEDHAYLENERHMGTRIVAVDRPAAHVDLDSVVFDNVGGAANGVRSLIAVGHRRIAFVGSDRTIYTHEMRLSGYRQALAEAGLPALARWVRTDAPNTVAAEQATRQLLDLDDGPTAIFAGNNIAAAGVLRALHHYDRRIAFIAFDDFDFADMLGVTVIAHDPGQMGSEAAQLALAGERDPSRPSTQIVLPTRLIRRGSGEIPPPAHLQA